MKKLLLILILLFLPSVFATPLNLTINLDTNQLGTQQPFPGKIIINYTGNISITDVLEAQIRDGSTVTLQAKLSDLLDDSFTYNPESYRVTATRNTLTLTNDTSYFGLFLEGPVSILHFDLEEKQASSYPDNVFLDIGNDNTREWQ